MRSVAVQEQYKHETAREAHVFIRNLQLVNDYTHTCIKIQPLR